MYAKFHSISELVRLRAGDIKRHPITQRASQLRRFHKKYGQFELDSAVELIHVVRDKNGNGYLAVEGATRVEACNVNPKCGPETVLDCRLYGNGVPPNEQQCWELFSVLNADRIAPGAAVQLTAAVGAQRQSAMTATRLIERLGPKFRARTGIWTMVRQYGDRVSSEAVEFVAETWDGKHHIPMQVVKSVAFLMNRKKDVEKLQRRIRALRKESPENWRLRAQTKMLSQLGRRDDATTWTARVLLGSEPTPESKKRRDDK